MHRQPRITFTGNDNTSCTSHGPISAVGGLETCYQRAVCGIHYTFMAVHLAIPAPNLGGAADINNFPDVFMDEGVEVPAIT